MSDVHALYRIFDPDDELLYIGITSHPRNRAMDHVRQQSWARRISRIEFQHFNSRDEVQAAERVAIIGEGPTFNVSHARSPLSDEMTRHLDALHDDTVRDEDGEEWVDPRNIGEQADGRAAADVMAKLLS